MKFFRFKIIVRKDFFAVDIMLWFSPKCYGSICGGNIPTINNFSLSQPFIRLAQCNLCSIWSLINIYNKHYNLSQFKVHPLSIISDCWPGYLSLQTLRIVQTGNECQDTSMRTLFFWAKYCFVDGISWRDWEIYPLVFCRRNVPLASSLVSALPQSTPSSSGCWCGKCQC